MTDEPADDDVEIIAAAVGEWYRHYQISPEDDSSQVLYKAAIDLFASGHRGVKQISSILIDEFVGEVSISVNAATSSSIH
jgi:hypothetical protein